VRRQGWRTAEAAGRAVESRRLKLLFGELKQPVWRMYEQRGKRRRGRREARDQARRGEEEAAAQEPLEWPPDNETIDADALPPSSAPVFPTDII
jgi:hypothetical protein